MTPAKFNEITVKGEEEKGEGRGGKK